MPWKEHTIMTERLEFVQAAQEENVNIRALCRSYGISSRTAYKWLKRYQEEDEAGLADRSRRPHTSPKKTSQEQEDKIIQVRQAHSAWGGRKIKAYLERQGVQDVPAASTITAILHRHERISPEESKKRKALQRFEMQEPNEIWQMDFKGPFWVGGTRCSPLTVLDDHSRYLVGLTACRNQKKDTVQAALTAIFRRSGLPAVFLTDNGRPWGGTTPNEHHYTELNLWLFRLGIRLIHSSPGHPQTIGKDERFHRTLKAEVLTQQTFENFFVCQNIFDAWRELYNHDRPHEALEMDVPATRYQPSPRSFPETLPPIEYDAGADIQTVSDNGCIVFQHTHQIFLGKIFAGYPVAIRPHPERDGEFKVYFCQQKIKTFEL